MRSSTASRAVSIRISMASPAFPCSRHTSKPSRAATSSLYSDQGFTNETPANTKLVMNLNEVEPDEFDCAKTAMRPFGGRELVAGNERAHRSLDLAGLQSDVIAVPSGGDKGGDLSAVFSCSDDIARVVLADCVGHGYPASGVARHVHHLLHKFQDIRGSAGLPPAPNEPL